MGLSVQYFCICKLADFKGSVQRKLRQRLLYIIQKLFTRRRVGEEIFWLFLKSKSNWAVQGALKGFYVNSELALLYKVKISFSATHLLEKSFRMMYSNLGLSFRWTLPLIILNIKIALCSPWYLGKRMQTFPVRIRFRISLGYDSGSSQHFQIWV